MADVARVLPRHWDGQRLLRFLAGLAALALAFAVQAGLAGATPVAAVAPSAVTTSTVTTTVDVPAPVTEPAPATPAGAPGSAATAEVPAAREAVVLSGAHPGVHGSRGPPLA